MPSVFVEVHLHRMVVNLAKDLPSSCRPVTLAWTVLSMESGEVGVRDAVLLNRKYSIAYFPRRFDRALLRHLWKWHTDLHT